MHGVRRHNDTGVGEGAAVPVQYSSSAIQRKDRALKEHEHDAGHSPEFFA